MCVYVCVTIKRYILKMYMAQQLRALDARGFPALTYSLPIQSDREFFSDLFDTVHILNAFTYVQAQHSYT